MPKLVLSELGALCASERPPAHQLNGPGDDPELQSVLEWFRSHPVDVLYTEAIGNSIDYVLDGGRTGRFDLQLPTVHPGERASVGANIQEVQATASVPAPFFFPTAQNLTALTTAITAKSTDATSPDGLYSIQSSRSGVSLVDSKGQSLITLIRSMTGGTKFEISWAPTSKRVVVATNSALGSAIVAAWTDDNGATWRKALEPDAYQTNIANQAQRDAGNRLIAESLTLGDWGSPMNCRSKET